MYLDILIKGACELDHFELFSSYGINKFILCNNPSSNNFISMKNIEKVFELYPSSIFYLLEIPEDKEIFLYYQRVFEQFGLSLNFFDDIQKMREVKYLDSLENIPAQAGQNSILVFDIESLMIDYRLIDLEATRNILGNL